MPSRHCDLRRRQQQRRQQSSSPPCLLNFLMRLDETQIGRLFPEFDALCMPSSSSASVALLGIVLPKEVVLQICLFCRTPTTHPGGFDVDTATQCPICCANNHKNNNNNNNNEQNSNNKDNTNNGKSPPSSIITRNSCINHGCSWDCVSMVRSRTPLLLPRDFFNVRLVNKSDRHVGLGLTTHPDLQAGIRGSTRTCGVFIDTKTFYYSHDLLEEEDNNNNNHETSSVTMTQQRRRRRQREERIPITKNTALNQEDVVLTRRGPANGEQHLGIAVDYDNHKILIHWPGGSTSSDHGDEVVLDMPEHLHNKLLYPLVQAWNGCGLEFVDPKELKNKAQKEFFFCGTGRCGTIIQQQQQQQNHHHFTDIPLYDRFGTALSREERAAIAERRGLCVGCGIRTHTINTFRKLPLTRIIEGEGGVYEGRCILCSPNEVPLHVWLLGQGRAASGGAT